MKKKRFNSQILLWTTVMDSSDFLRQCYLSSIIRVRSVVHFWCYIVSAVTGEDSRTNLIVIGIVSIHLLHGGAAYSWRAPAPT